MNERQAKLEQLQAFLAAQEEQYNLATDLEQYFIGSRTGCRCKYNHIRSQLNQLWESGLKAELNGFSQ